MGGRYSNPNSASLADWHDALGLNALHSVFPEARFGRTPGFDLEEWRREHKALEKLKRMVG